MFFVGISVLALLFTVMLYFIDKQNSAILDEPNPEEAFALLQAKLDEEEEEEDEDDVTNNELEAQAEKKYD